MIKINGITATNNFETQKEIQIKPTINEILDRMENNYQNIHNVQNQSYKTNTQSASNNSNNFNAEISNLQNKNVENQSIFSSILNGNNPNSGFENNNLLSDNNSLLLSILPTLLTKNKGVNTLKNSQNMIFKEILKHSNNPRLNQIAELLPKIFSNNSTPQMFSTETQTSPNQNKIDTFKKTDEYED